MRLEITEYVRRVEYYELEIDAEYLAQLNSHFRTNHPTLDFPDITEEDIAACLENDGEDYAYLAQEITQYYTLGEAIRDYVMQDLWDSWYDGEHLDTEDYELEIER